MQGPTRVTFDSLNGGQLVALFDRELAKVMENIQDPNTPEEATRSIQLSIKVKPDEGRGGAKFTVDSTVKLPSVRPVTSHVLLSFDGEKTEAFQYADPKQPDLPESSDSEEHHGARVTDIAQGAKKGA